MNVKHIKLRFLLIILLIFGMCSPIYAMTEHLSNPQLKTKIRGDIILLEWQTSIDIFDDLVGYQIEKKIDNENWRFLSIMSNKAVSFEDNIPEEYQKISYRIKAFDKEKNYSESSVSSIENPKKLSVTLHYQERKIIDTLNPPVLSLSTEGNTWSKTVIMIADKNLKDNKNIYEWSRDSFITVEKETSNEMELTSSKDMGEWYCRVLDKEGNSSIGKSIKVENIDDTIPTTPKVTVTNENGTPYTVGNFTSGKVQVTISDSEALSGIDFYEYSVDNGVQWKQYNPASKLSFSSNTIVKLVTRAINKVGTVGIHSAVIEIVMDNTPPTSPTFAIQEEQEKFLTIIKAGEDAQSGIDKTEFKVVSKENKGEWKIYDGQPMSLLNNDKLYARSYNKVGLFTVTSITIGEKTLASQSPVIFPTKGVENPTSKKSSWKPTYLFVTKKNFKKNPIDCLIFANLPI